MKAKVCTFNLTYKYNTNKCAPLGFNLILRIYLGGWGYRSIFTKRVFLSCHTLKIIWFSVILTIWKMKRHFILYISLKAQVREMNKSP